jgi:uncharacterized protein (TIGR02147 family)
MIFESSDYRSYLKKLLVERIQKNPSYSLRAFSTSIGVSSSMLSEVLKGEKKLSPGKAGVISSRLDLSVDEERYFIGLVQLEGARDVKQKEKILSRLQELAPNRNIRDLSVDQFHTIADWICASGMALLTGYPNGLTASEIAARLSVSPFEATEAMDRWMRLDLLEIGDGNRYRRVSHDHLMMKSSSPDGALRKFHKSMLEKAITSLETQTPSEKFIGSETLAFDPEQLAEVSEVIESAVAKILKIAKTKKRKKEVYHLGFQFFRVTKKEIKK